MVLLIIYWLVTIYFLRIVLDWLLQFASGKEFVVVPGTYYFLYIFTFPVVLLLWGIFITYKWFRSGRKLSDRLRTVSIVLLVSGGLIFFFLSSLSLYSLRARF